MVDITKLSYNQIIEQIDGEAVEILKGSGIIQNKAEMSRFLLYEKGFHIPLAKFIRDNPKANTVGKAFETMMHGEPLLPEPAQETAGEKFIKGLDKADGTIDYLERLLREQIIIKNLWSSETQVDFLEQLLTMQGNLQTMIDRLNENIKNS